MKSFILITLLTLGLLTTAITSFAQKCDCDSLLNALTIHSMRRVKNSDSFKFINFRRKGVIKSIDEKDKILKLFVADSVWIPVSGHKDSITVKFFKFGSLAGRMVTLLDGIIIDSAKVASLTYNEALRVIMFQTNSQTEGLHYLAKNIDLGDEYFEVYFNVEGRVIMSPTICRKLYCELIDNIISYFRYVR